MPNSDHDFLATDTRSAYGRTAAMRPPAWISSGAAPRSCPVCSGLTPGWIVAEHRSAPRPARLSPGLPRVQHEPGAELTAARGRGTQCTRPAGRGISRTFTLAQHIGDCRTAPVRVPTTSPARASALQIPRSPAAGTPSPPGTCCP